MDAKTLHRQGHTYAEIAWLLGRDWRPVKRYVEADAQPRASVPEKARQAAARRATASWGAIPAACQAARRKRAIGRANISGTISRPPARIGKIGPESSSEPAGSMSM